ncbi:MAG: low molecular weight phosphotyrosine protein phosphatase [Bdellovibrionaceae bacterium]|nr:low molecular weight phosphotyrosine protein phosphatase [Pseudobdellovibrionaceae bacterium]
MSKVKVLFVCLGNICRSPAAEAVMNSFVEKENLNNMVVCDSAATSGHHEGDTADPRTIQHAKKRGHEVTSISRPFNPKKDFDEFDYIVVMDDANFSDIQKMDNKRQHGDKIFKMADFCANKKYKQVPDPYYGGPEEFETVMDILEDACQGLLQKIKGQSL